MPRPIQHEETVSDTNRVMCSLSRMCDGPSTTWGLPGDVQEEIQRRADDDLEDVPDDEAGDPACLEILERAVGAVAQRVLDRLLVPADSLRSRSWDERQDELLARRVEPACGAVQRAEPEALHFAVEAAAL